MSHRERLSPFQVRTYFAPNKELPPAPESRTPDIVIYAGTSHRRLHFLKYAFPGSEVISIPAGNEEETHNIGEIMQDKLAAVTPIAKIKMLKNPGKTGIVVASDIESFPLIYENGRTSNQGKGKPKSLEEVRATFERMYEASRKMSEAWGKELNPYYLINASSGTRDLQTGDLIPKHHGCVIELDAETIRDFGTTEGFDRYVGEFVDFFSSDRYSYNGVHPPICPTDVAGGFDTGVLTRMGAIIAIDTVNRNDPGFRDNLAYLINHSNVGIHSTVLRPFNPKIDQKVQDWPWLQTVTDYAMGAD